MPATKTSGKTAVKKSANRAKKDGASKPAPARPQAPAQRAPDPGLQQLEQKARQAEARAHEAERRAQQLEQDSQQTGVKVRGLERELRDAQAALQAQAAARERAAAETGPVVVGGVKKLRCPRCSGAMTEYEHDVVRADRCDSCHGIFFDDGELEQVVDKAIKDHDGQQHGGWFQSLFGRRGKAKNA